MTSMGQVERLTKIIELLIQRHPRSADVLLGVVPPPTDDEWLEMLRSSPDDLGVRVRTDPYTDRILSEVIKLDEIHRLIDAAGWESITEAARSIKEFFAEDWKVFCLHCRFVRGESRISDASSLQKVSRRVGLSPNTVSRKRKEIPRRIARDALSGFQAAMKW
ncbi:hypothetical protein [Dethiosulfovibrio salsuginis]|nr:hypothetical protein [Dethiosulfovibrio salsuginis]